MNMRITCKYSHKRSLNMSNQKVKNNLWRMHKASLNNTPR